MGEDKKYLLFDKRAIETIVSKSVLQSIEYKQGMSFINHLCGNGTSGLFEDIYIEYNEDGILFIGKNRESALTTKGYEIFCIDLTSCEILSERNHPSDLLTVVQKVFRTCLKIWNRQPFSSSERINQTKSIVFPFVFTDRRRIVIERANNIERLAKRKIVFPLLAYKYSVDEPHGEEKINTGILIKAGEDYAAKHFQIQSLFPSNVAYNKNNKEKALSRIEGNYLEGKGNFAYLSYELQYEQLTESQKSVVDFEDLHNPLRVEGAAGTGKTFSMIMRAYRLLEEAREKHQPLNMIFVSHNYSSCEQSKKIFLNYQGAQEYLEAVYEQKILFTTLLDYCREFAHISKDNLLENDAGDAKSYQLFLIEDVLKKAGEKHIFNTYKSSLSKEVREMLDDITGANLQNVSTMLQHEFSVQIKGRTNCTLEEYKELKSIPNGIRCVSERDKEFIFRLFTEYQEALQSMNNFDVDDVVLEALSKMNAPVWRRQRAAEGFDYIMVDEMHLFNFNEQNVFHYLTKDYSKKEVPICFALDYCQAVGDRGDTGEDYIEQGFGKLSEKKLRTVFRNSPKIADFCASIAASGVLMFKESFENPYERTQNNFTIQEERKADQKPVLYMCSNDSEMEQKLAGQLDKLMSSLQCKQKEIAIISYEPRYLTLDGAKNLAKNIDKKIRLIDVPKDIAEHEFPLYSPYEVNGLEFQAAVMIGVDEGRVPQTVGTSDISQNFVKYSAYNLLYLTSSRAKYRLILLGNAVNGKSSCLEHSIKSGYLDCKD